MAYQNDFDPDDDGGMYRIMGLMLLPVILGVLERNYGFALFTLISTPFVMAMYRNRKNR